MPCWDMIICRWMQQYPQAMERYMEDEPCNGISSCAWLPDDELAVCTSDTAEDNRADFQISGGTIRAHL
ncbi:hypothetical protein N7495_000854 [Penicillium taxi]|uniref:uncharacterized protein n=1 Tax=Penicillium taxi TaxID=168475 RepID=UPI002544FA72|nr:uncharacterized protein N7495_000854 [Penicillium taxi]KAJ5908172.1 hypothetical protein N7495_000854 [Penicillium taxi]